jgi:cyclic pyranopterin monophosphate synthase
MPGELSHLTSRGEARMVDVSAKPPMVRRAVAAGRITMAPSTLALIQSGGLPKGDVIATARIAGIQAAKETARLIPLCHPLPLSAVELDFQFDESALAITAAVKTTASTGVEMEALTAVTVAALTLYDMCKAVDKSMTLEGIRLTEKTRTPLHST